MVNSTRPVRRAWSLFLAVVLAAPIVVGALSAPAQAAGIPLYPDLKTLAPRDLRFDRADITPELTGNFHNVLRFSNTTLNTGEGPLILNAQINPSTRRGPATQRVMHDDGTFTDIPMNNDMYWHAAHSHYHFDNWNDYQLWSKSTYDAWIASGRTTGSPLFSGAKQTSCVIDEEFVTGAPSAAVYPGPYGAGGCDANGQNQLRMGLSVGWGDTYDWYRQLQWIDLGQSTLGNGTYVLRSVSDHLNIVHESAGKSDGAREGTAGNEAATTFVVSGGAIQDSDTPTGTVSINHVNQNTATPSVSVDVVGRDDVSGPNQFRLSNDGVTFKTFNYTSSGSFPTTASWNLTDATAGGNSAGGIKTVYAQFRDSSGKWGTSVTDTINLTTGGGPPPPPPPPPTGPYAQVVAADSPSGYWRLSETSGTNAGDSIGSSPGTYTGGVTLGRPSLLASDPNLSASFSGTNQLVAIPSTGAISPATNITVEAWIKPTSLPAAGAFRSIATKLDSYSLQFNGPRLEFTIMQGGARRRLQAPNGAIVAGNTYHVVGTYNGAVQRLYINGTQSVTANLTGAITVNSNALNIGSWNGSSEFFNGILDEVAVYPLVLSATQITNHYSAGINTAPPPVQAQLSISRNGTGNGSVASVPAGINCGLTCSASFASGTGVTLTATPAAGSTFAGWSGGGCTGTGTCTLTLSANTVVNAMFNLIPTSTLTITKSGTGTGTVTSSPAGINCGATCAATLPSSSGVTLTAAPAAGSVFVGWTGGDCSGSGSGPCALTLSSDTAVDAIFNAVPTSSLAVTKSGTGTGTVTSSPAGINCGTTCTAPFATGSTVAMTATPAAGSIFTGWSGACTGTGPCSIALIADNSVDAQFAPVPTANLSVSKAGAGTGTVTSSPAGINCGATCSAPFNTGSGITLSAAASSGSTFSGWSGGGCTGTGTCVVTLAAATTVTATFAVAPTSSYQQVVSADAPAGYWRLNETTGTTAANTAVPASPGTYRGVTLNQPGLLASASNKAVLFNSTTSRVQIASTPALSPTARVTVEAWIKPTALPAAGAFASIATKAESYSLQFNGPRLEFTIMQATVRRRLQAPVGAVAVGGTYHVVGTYDGTAQRLYINGAQVATAALTGAITANTTALYLGTWTGSNELYKGTIDEVAVYSTVLTPAQISNHRTTGTTVLVSFERNTASRTSDARQFAKAADTGLDREYIAHAIGRGQAAKNGVTIVNTRTGRVVRRIITGGHGPSSIAVNPAKHLVYVTAAVFDPTGVRGSVIVIDGRSGKILRSIATGPGPKAIAVNAKTGRIYVTEQTGTDGSGAIAVIDGKSSRILATIPIGPYERFYDNPFGLAVNANTNMVYASNPLDGNVYTIDGRTNAVVRAIGIGGAPRTLTVDAKSNTICVTGARYVATLSGRTGGVVSRTNHDPRVKVFADDPTSRRFA